MKKICYIVTLPLTIKAFFIPQLKCLADNGFDVAVICSSDNSLQNELGSKIRYIPIEIPRGISISGSVWALKELKDVFKKEKFDLVQYSTPNAAFYSSIAAKWTGIKVRNYHLMGLRYLGTKGIGRIILKGIEKITCINSTHIECVSNSNLELGIKERLFKREKATVVWNGSTGGVSLKRFNYSNRIEWRNIIRQKLGYTEDDFVYGFVGRITRDKGVNELLTAFSQLQDGSQLLIVGSLEGEKTLEQTLFQKSLNNSNIKFHKAVIDVEKYYAAIDVLILPSYREGFGNVIIEAAAMGTPVIVTDIPGPIDCVEKDITAFVIPVKDSVALVRSMQKIKNVDYEQMGIKALQFVKDRFEEKSLCDYIVKRKKQLLP